MTINAYIDEVLKDQPTHFWPLINGTYTDFVPANAYNALTLDSSPTFNQQVRARGINNGAGVGTNGYFGFTWTPKTTTQTLECWVDTLTDSGGSGKGILGQWGGAVGDGMMIYFAGNGAIDGYVQGNSITGSIVPVTRAQHIVFAWDGAHGYIYQDGVQTVTGALAGPISFSTGGPQIGSYGTGGTSNAFPGTIAMAATYDYALTAGRVKAHYLVGQGEVAHSDIRRRR